MDGSWHRAWRRLEVALFSETPCSCTSPPLSMSAASCAAALNSFEGAKVVRFPSCILPTRVSIMMQMHNLRCQLPVALLDAFTMRYVLPLVLMEAWATNIFGKVVSSESCPKFA